MNKLKICTIVGTRPEIIRLSKIIQLFDNYFNHVLVHTGQNYDYELNKIFFDDLGLRQPDYFLDINTNSLGNAIGDIIKKSEEVLVSENPDSVVILGDTNSSLSSIIARRLKIPIYHLEAGNRSFDLNVPEETNRIIVDHISDFNLVYTEAARRHLIAEGLSSRRIALIGSPLFEVIEDNIKKIEFSDIISTLNLEHRNYFLISLHREENVDSKSRLEKILRLLKRIYKEYKKPLIVSMHPRTKERIERFGLFANFQEFNIKFLKPFGFFDYMKLQINAKCTISDSGSISEESAILSFPAVTLRQSMERPEALEAGKILISSFDEDTILSAIKIATENSYSPSKFPPEYFIEDCSLRVIKFILGTAKIAHRWQGIEKNY